MLAAKGKVQVPQGEFWARCQYGVYDIKEASSAAHLYGHRIASAEAYTSANYTHTLDWFRQQADMSMTMHVNEMVVCASAAQEDDMLNISGNRQYALNRRNTYWKESRPFWDYQARGQYIPLSIDVTNSLKNRLVLDSRLPEAERIYPANAEPFKPTDSLVPSGMMDIAITQE